VVGLQPEMVPRLEVGLQQEAVHPPQVELRLEVVHLLQVGLVRILVLDIKCSNAFLYNFLLMWLVCANHIVYSMVHMLGIEIVFRRWQWVARSTDWKWRRVLGLGLRIFVLSLGSWL
jgi:hypothetical protein